MQISLPRGLLVRKTIISTEVIPARKESKTGSEVNIFVAQGVYCVYRIAQEWITVFTAVSFGQVSKTKGNGL
jgi:hypothetical protein